MASIRTSGLISLPSSISTPASSVSTLTNTPKLAAASAPVSNVAVDGTPFGLWGQASHNGGTAVARPATEAEAARILLPGTTNTLGQLSAITGQSARILYDAFGSGGYNGIQRYLPTDFTDTNVNTVFNNLARPRNDVLGASTAPITWNNRLRTDYAKPYYYLAGNKDDVYFHDIEGVTDKWVQAEFASEEPEQWVNIDDEPIWWLHGIVGGKFTTNAEMAHVLDADGKPTGAPVPVMVYQYRNRDKQTNGFALTPDGEGYTMPIMVFGEGDELGRKRAFIYKAGFELAAKYHKGDGTWVALRLGDDGLKLDLGAAGQPGMVPVLQADGSVAWGFKQGGGVEDVEPPRLTPPPGTYNMGFTLTVEPNAAGDAVYFGVLGSSVAQVATPYTYRIMDTVTFLCFSMTADYKTSASIVTRYTVAPLTVIDTVDVNADIDVEETVAIAATQTILLEITDTIDDTAYHNVVEIADLEKTSIV